MWIVVVGVLVGLIYGRGYWVHGGSEREGIGEWVHCFDARQLFFMQKERSDEGLLGVVDTF